MRFFFLSAIFFFCSAHSFAGGADTTRIYFDINEKDIGSNRAKLDSLISAFDSEVNLTIYGYADFIGTPEQNKILSEQRAKNVREYFKKSNNKNIKIVACLGKEQVKQSGNPDPKIGEPQNRRVDIISNKAQPGTGAQGETGTSKKKDLKGLEVGESIDVEGLTFKGGKHLILPESEAVLSNLLTTLKENPTIQFQIIGHVCCEDAKRDGWDFDTRDWHLSENRAKFVYDFLIKNGIDKTRMSYLGVGSTAPKIFPERTEKDQQANRRVEIKIVGK